MVEAKIQPDSELLTNMTKGTDPRELPWYKTDFEQVPEPSKTILEKYSKISPDQVLQHVKDVFPYPCIGEFRFLDMSISDSRVYPEILERLKTGQKLLDVGCAVGQELRNLVYNGIPSENLYASDLHQSFFDIGYDLFQDRETLKSTFIASDIFDDNSALVEDLRGKIDIVNAASLFHLFSWDQQVVLAKRIVSLVHAQPGSLIIGRQIGCYDPISPLAKENMPRPYRHNVETWKMLWEQVQAETGTEWEVDAWLEEWGGAGSWMKDYHGDKGTFRIWFVVRRV
ncbi:hypothetical protein N7490_008727 [Penicillium lividum]|nr:hypothetical protein N7490_008727 [Penicillium lividum]